MPKQRVYPKLITGTVQEIQRALNQLFEYILALESGSIGSAPRIGAVTTPHVPYSSSDGILGDTTLHWSGANSQAWMEHTTLLGGWEVRGFGTGVFGFAKTMTARGTPAAPTATVSGDIIGFYGMQGYDPAVGFLGSASATILAYATQNFTATAHGTKIVVQVTPNGSVTRATAITVEQDGTATTKSAIPVADSAHSLGSTGLRWLKLWVDDIQVTTNAEVAGAIHAVGEVRTDTRFNFNGNSGITGGRVVKDSAGANKNVTIEGGIITYWET